MADPITTTTSVRRTLVRNTATGWLGHLINILTTLYLTPQMIHGLGASGYGLWILTVQLTGYSGLLDLGVRFALTKHVAEQSIQQERGRLAQLLSTALALTSGVSIVVMALALSIAPWFGAWFNVQPGDAAVASQALIIVALTTAVGFPMGVFTAAFAGYRRYDLVDGLGILQQILRTVASVVVLRRGGGLVGIAYVNLASSMVTHCGSYALLSWKIGPLGLSLASVSRSIARQIVSFGTYAFLATFGWYLVHATDLTVIGANLSPVDVAHYGLAANVMAVVMAGLGAFTRSLVPIAAELTAAEDQAAIQRVYLHATRATLLIALPALAVLVLAGPELLGLWVGQEFARPSGALLQILALAYLPIVINSAGQAIALMARSRGRFVVLILLEGLLNLGISLLLVRFMGPVGVAVGTLIPATIFHGVLWPKQLSAEYKIQWARYWRESLRPLLLPLIGATLAFELWAAVFQTRIGLWVLIPTGAFAATFYALALYSCFSPAERSAWIATFRRFASGLIRG